MKTGAVLATTETPSSCYECCWGAGKFLLTAISKRELRGKGAMDSVIEDPNALTKNRPL